MLFGRSAIQPACYMKLICLSPSFNGLNSPLLKKCFSNLNANEAVKSSGLVVQLKIKCLLMETTHDDMIEGKEVYIQLSLKKDMNACYCCVFKVRQFIVLLDYLPVSR